MSDGPKNLKITRWKQTRFWAVWLNEELLTITVYKKGALSVCKHLLESNKNNESTGGTLF
jgi:hypothetical protein